MRSRTHPGRAIAVNQISRIAYGAVVLVTIAIFVWVYGIH